MRVAYIGNFNPEFSTENDVRKAFEFLGHEVVKLQENKVNVASIYSTVLDPHPHSNPTAKVDLLLITSTWDAALDLKEWLGLMKMCANANLPTATLHLDTFWSTSRNGRQWWLNPMFYTAYIFTADGDYQDKWKAFGKNHIWLPPAVRHDAAKVGKSRPEYECDVAFVGSNGVGYHEDVWGYRKELVDNLRSMCKRNGWTWRNPGGDHHKIDRGDDMNDFYASARVTVGDSLCLKKEESRYWSDRLPEATGRGGTLIMPWINDAKTTYPEMLMYRWGDFKDLEGKIFRLLDDDEERKYITESCHHITSRDHTYINRVKTILEKVKL